MDSKNRNRDSSFAFSAKGTRALAGFFPIPVIANKYIAKQRAEKTSTQHKLTRPGDECWKQSQQQPV